MLIKKDIKIAQTQSKTKGSLKDGLMRQNVVLMSGLLAGPVIAGATNLENAVTISLAFTLLTFFTVVICRVIPRKIVYTLRIIVYTIVAAIIYIPVAILVEQVMGVTAVRNVGIYLPILIANPLIHAKSETRFYIMPAKSMLVELIGYILGFDIVCLLTGALRDILVNERLGWVRVETNFSVPALETTFGGMVLIGIGAGLARAVYNKIKKIKEGKAV